ncbi:MAG: 3-keto-5-aminohexanoate cleavage protein [Acidimicrobiales bacterium]
MEPLIIEAAVNGAATKRRNPNVPLSAEEIAADALACLEAGAAIVHNHTDDVVLGGDGRHSAAKYLDAWGPVLAARPDAILYPTMSGGAAGRIKIQDRYQHFADLYEAGVLGMGVADPGSVNLAGVKADGSISPTPWCYENTPVDIAWMFAWNAERGLPVHVSIFEPGCLRMALAHHARGSLPKAAKLQFYLMGATTLTGLPAEEWSLEVYLKLLGDAAITWMVSAVGGDTVGSGLAKAAIERGGHVRVGLEDYLDPSGARRTPTNAELVAEVVELAKACGRPVATSAEATRILHHQP